MKFFIIFVKSFQSIYDLAMQQYGSIDHVDILLQDNPTLNLSDDLAVGTQVKIRENISVLDEAAKKYFTESDTKVATWTNDGISPGYTPGFSSCPPVTVNAKNSDNEILATDSFSPGSPGTLNITDVEIQLGGNTLGSHVVKPVINIPLKVYYNRPDILNTASTDNYDEGYLYLNNYDPPFHPTDGVFQELDLSASPDYLKYFNAFGHKFRLTGLTGGYYDFNTAQYKDVDGNVSTFQAEFGDPVGVSSPDGYIIDHLTGIGWRAQRGGASTWTNSIANVPLSSVFGFTDWRVPTSLYAITLARVDVVLWLYPAYRPPFQYDQSVFWTCTTFQGNPLTAFRADAATYATTSTKSTTGANNGFSRLHYLRTDFVIQP